MICLEPTETYVETLTLVFIHDMLVMAGIEEPLSYIDLRVKLQTDTEFVERLKAYHNLMIRKLQDE